MYLTESHITAYEVTRGSITGNYRFHAFSLRDETVVNEITYAVQVLFDVPVHKIKVVKMSSR